MNKLLHHSTLYHSAYVLCKLFNNHTTAKLTIHRPTLNKYVNNNEWLFSSVRYYCL